MRVEKSIFGKRESAVYFSVKREMGNLFPVKRDFSASREPWFLTKSSQKTLLLHSYCISRHLRDSDFKIFPVGACPASDPPSLGMLSCSRKPHHFGKRSAVPFDAAPTLQYLKVKFSFESWIFVIYSLPFRKWLFWEKIVLPTTEDSARICMYPDHCFGEQLARASWITNSSLRLISLASQEREIATKGHSY